MARSQARYVKHHLPNYGVFDEARYFVAGQRPARRRRSTASRWPWRSARTSGRRADPVTWAREQRRSGAGRTQRLALRAGQGRRAPGAVPAARARGGGGTRLREHDRGPGRARVRRGLPRRRRRTALLLARAPQFEPALLVVDVDPDDPRPSPAAIATRLDALAEVYGALVLALRDYVDKNGFRSVLLGLSGGIDSALVAALSCDAFGPDTGLRGRDAERLLVGALGR